MAPSQRFLPESFNTRFDLPKLCIRLLQKHFLNFKEKRFTGQRAISFKRFGPLDRRGELREQRHRISDRD